MSKLLAGAYINNKSMLLNAFLSDWGNNKCYDNNVMPYKSDFVSIDWKKRNTKKNLYQNKLPIYYYMFILI